MNHVTQFRLLCNALGFMAVVTSDTLSPKDLAVRAAGVAQMMEDFCRATVPEAFPQVHKTNRAQEDEMLVVNLQGAHDTFELHQQMASVIVEIIREKGSCDKEDLYGHGFSLDEIERGWLMATSLAKVELNWMDA